MSQQQINQLIIWTLLLRSRDTKEINPKLESLVVYSPAQNGTVPSFSIQDYIDLANRVTLQSEVDEIADEVFNQSNGLIHTGVRADKSARPIKS